MTAHPITRRSYGLLLALLLTSVAAVWHEDTSPTVAVVPAIGPAVAHLLWLTETSTTMSIHPPQITRVCATPSPSYSCTDWMMVVPLGWRASDLW